MENSGSISPTPSISPKHTSAAVTHARTALVDFVFELPFVVHAATCRCMRLRVSIRFVSSFGKRRSLCPREFSLIIWVSVEMRQKQFCI